MKDHKSTFRNSWWRSGQLKFSVAFAGLCVVTGCGAGGAASAPGGGAATPPGTGATPAVTTSAGTPASAGGSAPAGGAAPVVQCDTTETGSSLPKVAGQVVLPAGVTVPKGDEVYGTSVKLASGALYMIGHPGVTSVGCYQPTSAPDGGAEITVVPDNGLYSEGAIEVAAGLSSHPFGTQCRLETAAPSLDMNDCADIQDGNPPVTIATGTPTVSALAYVVPAPPELGQYLENTLAADTSKPVVEMIVDSQTAGASRAEAFSGAVACSMDAPADCLATLPFFLAQAAAGSPMTAADYSRAFAQINAVVSGKPVTPATSAAPVSTAPAASSTAVASSTAAGTGSGTGSRTEVAHYSIEISQGYTIPIGAGGTPPTLPAGSGLSYRGYSTFATGTASEDLADMGSGTPTYAACSTVTGPIWQRTLQPAPAGEGFCYTDSASGVLASVTVLSYAYAGDAVIVEVTVWK